MAAGTEPGTGVALLALLDEMLRLYARLEEMGAEAAQCADGVSVLDILRRRQGPVDELARCDARLAELRERAGREALAPEERSAIERRLGAVAQSAARLAAADAALRERLTARRDEMADELAGAGRGRSAHSAYTRPGGHGGARLKDTEV